MTRVVPLRVTDLSIHYGQRTAARDIDLTLSPGRLLGIVGPSGCGKSSFLWSLNRMTDLIPGCRVSGQVDVLGTQLYGGNIDLIHLRRRVGMIFQAPSPFALSIRRNIELPLRDHGVRDKTDLEKTTQKALSCVGLWDEVKDRLHRSALELSGGQQQRLCIARALALTPEVLLLDEPCSALDPMSTRALEECLVNLKETCTIVVVTHNIGQAKRMADDLAVFWVDQKSGYLLEYGSAEQVFAQPQQEQTRAYLSGMQG